MNQNWRKLITRFAQQALTKPEVAKKVHQFMDAYLNQNPGFSVGEEVLVISENDNIAMKMAKNKKVKLVHKLEDASFLTDFFVPGAENVNDEVLRHGFLKVRESDIKKVY